MSLIVTMIFILIIFLAFIILAISAGTNNNNNMNNNAKYAFYYLLSLVALIFTALSVGMIAFGIINKTVFDVLNLGASTSDTLKFAISAIIIATPIFFIMQNLIGRGLKKGELAKDSGVRRWLTYFILLVSSVTILGVFINIINNFLSGELTLNSILKALSIIVIAAAVFSFYFYDIKRENVTEKNVVMKVFFFASLALVTIAFISSWFFVESPVLTRAKRLDQNLINNINNLENAVNSYNDKYKKLPNTIDEIKNNKDIYLDLKSFNDPETGAPISYKKISETTFEFCASFRTDNKNVDSKTDTAYYSDPTKTHLAGYQCVNGQVWSVAKPVQPNVVN